MSIARLDRGVIKVLKDLNLLRPYDSIDMQVLTDLKRCFLGGVSILPVVSPHPPIHIRWMPRCAFLRSVRT